MEEIQSHPSSDVLHRAQARPRMVIALLQAHLCAVAPANSSSKEHQQHAKPAPPARTASATPRPASHAPPTRTAPPAPARARPVRRIRARGWGLLLVFLILDTIFLGELSTPAPSLAVPLASRTPSAPPQAPPYAAGPGRTGCRALPVRGARRARRGLLALVILLAAHHALQGLLQRKLAPARARHVLLGRRQWPAVLLVP
jgi:hypothetical protein